jgi:hypothetical protein
VTNEQAKARYAAADTNRRFEIDLLWKRAAFFWGFLTAAFAAYFLLLDKSKALALVISSFGIVSSFVWYQANRASSFWQKVWEQNLLRDETCVLGARVYDRVPLEAELGKSLPFIGWKRVSLSGLTTGFSLYTVIVWAVLSAIPAYAQIRVLNVGNGGMPECLSLAFFAFSLCFGISLYHDCCSHPSLPSLPPTAGTATQPTSSAPD